MGRPTRRHGRVRILTAAEEKTATDAQLVVAHKPLVQKMARNFTRYGMEFDDLVQEGNVALIVAAAKFDREKGFRFSTYAHWWVRSFMQDAVIREYSLVGQPMSRDGKARFFKQRRPRDVSVNAPVSSDGLTIGDLLVSPDPLPEALVIEMLEEERVTANIQGALRLLDPRESEIITSRLLTEPKVGLEALGVRFGISKERVRQLESRALEKMRVALADLEHLQDR